LSIIVMTVSRCIIACECGSSTAITFCAAPAANSRSARFSTPIALDRSPSPIITTPLPSTWMSPPSSVAKPVCGLLGAVPDLEVGVRRTSGGSGRSRCCAPTRGSRAGIAIGLMLTPP
jgi:hypothetical protein